MEFSASMCGSFANAKGIKSNDDRHQLLMITFLSLLIILQAPNGWHVHMSEYIIFQTTELNHCRIHQPHIYTLDVYYLHIKNSQPTLF